MIKSIPGKLILSGLFAALACNGFTQPGGEVASLEGTNWQLVKITVAGGYEFVPDDPGKYVLNFRSDNRLTGNSDCNRLMGSWYQEDRALKFDPFAAGRSLCPPGSLHNTLALYLGDVVAFDLRPGRMVLTTTTRGVAMEFESRD